MTAVTAPPKVARNLTRSFFEIGHKRCNSNDQISNPDIQVGELRATLLGNYSGISNGRPTDVEGVRWSGRQSCGATVPAGGGRARPCNDPKHLATRQRTRQHPCGGRRRARAAGPGAGNTSGVTQPHPAAHAPPRRHRDAAVLTPVGHNKAAQPQWGRAAVAVALGFEPRVAVTPHSISSAAPSAARTRYLT